MTAKIDNKFAHHNANVWQCLSICFSESPSGRMNPALTVLDRRRNTLNSVLSNINCVGAFRLRLGGPTGYFVRAPPYCRSANRDGDD